MLLGAGKILGRPELCFDNVVGIGFAELIVGCSALKQARLFPGVDAVGGNF